MIGKADKTYRVYLMSLMRERLRRGLNLYAVPSPVTPAASEREGLAALIRSIPTVNVVQSREPGVQAGATLVDAMPP